MGQSDTGSNEYEDSSDEYTNEGTTVIQLAIIFFCILFIEKY